MSAIFKGQISINKLPDLEFIPKVGIRQRPKHIRTRDQAVALGAQYMAAGMRATVTQEGDSPIWRVEAQVEGATGDPSLNIQNTHELRVNVNNPDFKSNLKTQSFFAGAAASLSFIQKLGNAVISGEMTYDDARADIAAAETLEIEDDEIEDAYNILDELLLGADSYTQFSYVYVHTFNFGPLADLISDFSNVGRIFTSAQVEQAENTPAEHALPEGEWLKLPPERIDSLGQNTALKYEYWWANTYSRYRYDEADL